MENEQHDDTGSKKQRISKGKLKRPSTKSRRQSKGFSTSFTQKTLNNNTLLAQSLAKEKSRNEKLFAVHQECMATRNEALMRLNETEASFDRLGMMAENAIKQMQQVVATVGEMFAEIRTSKNNPRNSANMRGSWDEAATSAGHAIIPQPLNNLPHINGRMQENVAANSQAPVWPFLTTLESVSPIEEELETSCSDDEDVRENSLISRRAPLPRNKNTREFYRRAYAQNAQEGPSSKGVRAPGLGLKMPQRIKLAGPHDLGLVLFSEETKAIDKTSLSIVDMDETIVQTIPTTFDGDEEAKPGTSPSFNTVTTSISNASAGDLTYEEVFCVPEVDKRIDESMTTPSSDKIVLSSVSSKKAVHNTKQSLPKLTMHSDPNLVPANSSKAKSPSVVTRSAKSQIATNPDRSNTFEHHDVAPLPTESTSEAEKAGRPTKTPDSRCDGETPPETRSAYERPTVASAKLPATSKSADMPRVAKKRRGGRKRRGNSSGPAIAERKRGPPSAREMNDTPTRGSQAKAPKVTALFDKLRESTATLASEDEFKERRTRRAVPQASYKEPTLNQKLRRPTDNT